MINEASIHLELEAGIHLVLVVKRPAYLECHNNNHNDPEFYPGVEMHIAKVGRKEVANQLMLIKYLNIKQKCCERVRVPEVISISLYFW